MLEPVLPSRPVLYLAFNKRVVDEAKGRLRSTTLIKTFNGLGHGMWGKGRTLKLDTKKTNNLFKEMVDALPKDQRNAAWDCYSAVADGVGRAKALGYIPSRHAMAEKSLVGDLTFHASLDETPDDLAADLIDDMLSRSISAAFKGHIDFNDQLYMPALFSSKSAFSAFPTILVDEAQDLNPIQHCLISRLVTGRLIIVGDPYQSIYGFRGAKAEGMASLEADFDMDKLSLSVSFRCPEAIVRAAQWRVPHFRWFKTGGKVETLHTVDIADLPDDSVILCRNNAPLLTAAFLILAAGRSVSIVGSDIGPRIVGLMRKLGDEDQQQSTTLDAIAEWEAIRLERDSKSAADLAACMRVFVEQTSTLGTAISYAEHIFAQRGGIQLSTIHKAKGLEWSHVYFLNPNLIGHNEQEKNLRYVAQTRSADYLAEISMEALQ